MFLGDGHIGAMMLDMPTRARQSAAARGGAVLMQRPQSFVDE